MAITPFVNGLSSFGMPVLPSTNGTTTGNVFFVENSSLATGVDDPAYGTNPNLPFKTINYAVTKCTANNGDVIFVGPGHTETISAAGGITVGVAGVSIIGLGQGSSRPTINWTATAGTFLISANNVTVSNIYCTPTGIDAVVTPFSLTSAAGNTTLSNIECYFAKTSYVALKGFLTATTAAAANNLTVDSCFIHGDAVANCTNAIQLVGGANIRITNNFIMGNFTTSLGCVNNITAVVTNILIKGNTLVNGTTSATKVVVLYTGSTGALAGNTCGIGTGTAPFASDAAWWAGNWSVSAVATTSTLI